jgi:hypothetical protein
MVPKRCSIRLQKLPPPRRASAQPPNLQGKLSRVVPGFQSRRSRSRHPRRRSFTARIQNILHLLLMGQQRRLLSRLHTSRYVTLLHQFYPRLFHLPGPCLHLHRPRNRSHQSWPRRRRSRIINASTILRMSRLTSLCQCMPCSSPRATVPVRRPQPSLPSY